MPDISKINALDIGSVSKVDGLAKASILDIDGVAVPLVAPPLDTYTSAIAAYSVRLLRTAYTGVAMRVRRDTAGGTGDDDEADIAFDSGVISLDSAISNASAGVTATTLGQFLNVGTVGGTTYTNPDSLSGTASCFVDEWKDQSGNANHTSQATFASQPQIHSGTVNTDLITENGKPAVLFDGTDDTLTRSTSDSITGFVSLFTVGTSDNLAPILPNNARSLFSIDTTVTNGQRRANIIWNAGAGTNYYHYTSVYGANNQIASATVDTQYLHSSIFDTVGNESDGAIDGGTLVNFSGTINTMSNYDILVGTSSAAENWSGYIQEIIAYKLDQDTNRSGIETNLNSYFSIF